MILLQFIILQFVVLYNNMWRHVDPWINAYTISNKNQRTLWMASYNGVLLHFTNKLLYELLKSVVMNLRAFSWILSILYALVLLQKCHTAEQ